MPKRSVRLIAYLLLLCFTVAALPFDFFHSHTSRASCVEGSKYTTCHHKLHLSKTENPCFACGVHFDKTFILSESEATLLERSDSKLLPSERVEFYFVKPTTSSSRGPPLIPATT
jgi:hypothetical protein